MPMRPFPEVALPAGLTAEARRALDEALRSEIYGLTFAGRILRAPRSGEAARRALRAWLGRTVGAGRAARVAEVVADKARFGRELLALRTGEAEATERTQGHLWTLLLLRDDMESLLVALGVARIARQSEGIAGCERKAIRAVEAFDSAAERLRLARTLTEPTAARAADRAPTLRRMRALAEGATTEWWLAPFRPNRPTTLQKATPRAFRAAG